MKQYYYMSLCILARKFMANLCVIIKYYYLVFEREIKWERTYGDVECSCLSISFCVWENGCLWYRSVENLNSSRSWERLNLEKYQLLCPQKWNKQQTPRAALSFSYTEVILYSLSPSLITQHHIFTTLFRVRNVSFSFIHLFIYLFIY